MSGIVEAVEAAYLAGFRGDGLRTIVAIAGAETGYVDSTNNTARPGREWFRELTDAERAAGIVPEFSVGPLQINLEVHESAISEARARDTFDAMRYAFSLSQGGVNFWPWSTFALGMHERHLLEADRVIAAFTVEAPPPVASEPAPVALPRLLNVADDADLSAWLLPLSNPLLRYNPVGWQRDAHGRRLAVYTVEVLLPEEA